jgi:hypothetical protein
MKESNRAYHPRQTYNQVHAARGVKQEDLQFIQYIVEDVSQALMR